MSLEKQIIDTALLYEEDGKQQVASTSEKNNSWYKEVHQHFQRNIVPHLKEYPEHFVEYYPAWFGFGDTSHYKQALSNSKVYRHTYGTYGTGYICFTDKNIYVTAINVLTKKYSLYPTGTTGFALFLLEGLTGERNDRQPYNGDKTWTIEYSSVVGTQITQLEKNGSEVVYIKTTSIDWQIHEHFTNTLPIILTLVKMGMAGKLENIWAKPESINSDIPDLLKKLNELQEAGIITEAEFQQKKQKLLNQI